jgi:hypothetical protein
VESVDFDPLHVGATQFSRTICSGSETHQNCCAIRGDLVDREPCRIACQPKGLDLGGQVVVGGGGEREADAGVSARDLFENVQVLEDQRTLGDDVDGKAELGNDSKGASRQVGVGFQRHEGVVHRAEADGPLDALAGEFVAQQLDGVDLDEGFFIEVVDLIAFGARVAVNAELLDTIPGLSCSPCSSC